MGPFITFLHVKVSLSRELITLSIPLFFLACPDSTGPVYKDPRSYSWTVDTLELGGTSYHTTMLDMYAVDSKNIYVVGFNDYYEGGRCGTSTGAGGRALDGKNWGKRSKAIFKE